MAELRSGLVMTTHLLTPLIGELRSSMRNTKLSLADGAVRPMPAFALGLRELNVLDCAALLAL